MMNALQRHQIIAGCLGSRVGRQVNGIPRKVRKKVAKSCCFFVLNKKGKIKLTLERMDHRGVLAPNSYKFLIQSSLVVQ
jgi:hypothetical protein